MRRILGFLVAATVAVSAVSASAATFVATEGARDTILGSTKLGGAKAKLSAASDLGIYGAGDSFELYGRIVTGADSYLFEVKENTQFALSFNFDGYTTKKGTVGASGFLSTSKGANTAVFRLIDANDTSKTLASVIAKTGISSAADNGGSPVLFSASAGSYYLQIDGAYVKGGGKSAANYDLRMTTLPGTNPAPAPVPLPGSAVLLMAGLGGLAAVRRRVKA